MEGRKVIVIKAQFTYNTNGSSFDFKAASLYHLVLHIGDTDYSIGISHPHTGKIAHLYLYNQNLHTHPILPAINASQFAETKVFVNNSQYTLVPAVFFEPQEASSFLAAVTDIEEAKVFYQHLPEVDSYLVFCIHNKLVENVEAWTGHTSFQHHIGALISSQSQFYLKPSVYSVFIDFNNTSFTQTVFKGRELIHCNTFEFKTLDDIVYYSYYPLEQLNLMPNDVEINVSGKIPNFEELVTVYKKYSQRVYELSPREINNIGITESRSLLRVILNMQCG